MNIIAIIGSRTFNDFDLLVSTVDPLKPSAIVSGGARGADRLGAEYAKLRNLPLTEFLPDWNTHGKAAGFIRNQYIIDACDMVVAFWDGKSRGTTHSLQLARKAHRRIYIVGFDK